MGSRSSFGVASLFAYFRRLLGIGRAAGSGGNNENVASGKDSRHADDSKGGCIFTAKDILAGNIENAYHLDFEIVEFSDIGLVGSVDDLYSSGDGVENCGQDELSLEMAQLGLPQSFQTGQQNGGGPSQARKSKRKKKRKRGKGERAPKSNAERVEDCWYEAYDSNSGHYYYYNMALGQTQWTVPDGPYIPLNANSANYSEVIRDKGGNAGELEVGEKSEFEQKCDMGLSEDYSMMNTLQGTNEASGDHGSSTEMSGLDMPNASVQQHANAGRVEVSGKVAGKVRSELPRKMFKYWLQRYSLFSKYDDGIELDTEGWYSATPECIARHQARKSACNIVVDAFAGVGGNAIQLAMTCDKVIAIDICPRRLEIARHNARVYGVESKIEFICGDFYNIAPSLNADMVFVSPPWGGPSYQLSDALVLNEGGSELGKMLVDTIRMAGKILKQNSAREGLVLFLPKNSDLVSLSEICGEWRLKVEVMLLNGHLKAITAYLGEFSDG